jgi:hypothetical protein
MPVTRLRIRLDAGAVDRTFILAYLRDFGTGPLDYLQVVRGPNFVPQGGENSATAEEYWMTLPTNIRDLVTLLTQHLGINDDPHAGPAAILRAPSGRNLICPFFGGVKRRFQNAINLSRQITKGNVNSGGQGVAFNDVLNGIQLGNLPVPHLPDALSIVVVDDLFNSGKTIAAIMERLDPHVPADSSYILACPLRVPIAAVDLAGLGIEHHTLPLAE